MSLEPIEPPQTELTGEEIIEDVCTRLAEELSRSCYLTAISAYHGYSGRISAELQLLDFDTTTVKATATIGNPDLVRPSEHFEVVIPVADPSAVRERSGLTPPSLERFESAQTPAKIKTRYYTPRKSNAAAK
jgi:hypothetical protein